MSETISAAWIGVVGTVVGGLLGAWWGAKISRDTARQLLIHQAKAEFTAAFTQTLTELHVNAPSLSESYAMKTLNAGYVAHLGAYIRFRSILSPEGQRKIDHAWKQYTKDDEYEIPEERDFYRFSHLLEPQTTEHQNLLAIKHVNALLQTAT